MADRIWKEEDVRPSRKLDENARPSLLQQAHRSGSPPLPTTCQGSAGAPAIRQQKNELPFDRHRRRLSTTPDANSKFFLLFIRYLRNFLKIASQLGLTIKEPTLDTLSKIHMWRRFSESLSTFCWEGQTCEPAQAVGLLACFRT
jgi:hypothetical protein